MKKLSLITLLLAAFFWGCEQDMIIDLPPAETKITVNSLVPADSLFYVVLSPSRRALQDYNYETALGPSSVALYLGTTRVDSQYFPDSTQGCFFTQTPHPGEAYTLKVYAAGLPSVTASDTVPSLPNVSTWNYVDSAGVDANGNKYGELTFTIDDPANEANYYDLYTEGDGYWWHDSISGDSFYVQNSVYFESYDPLIQDRHYFSDETFNGTKRSFVLRVHLYEGWGTPVNQSFHFTVVAMSRSSYRYKVSFELYQSVDGNPFAEPVLIYSNVNGGYGIFGFLSSLSVQVN